jgi:hypothetical protein
MFFALLASSVFYISAPVAEMRESPKGDSEIVSQALFSDQVEPLEEASGWVKVQLSVDHYQGWVRKEVVCKRECPFPRDNAVVAYVTRCAAHVYGKQDTVFGPIVTLPFESKLEVLDQSNARWLAVALPDGTEAYIQRGDVRIGAKTLTRSEMLAFSRRFMDLPYTWGGRSSFGYDCSGFVQMLYRQMGIAIPRDSRQQVRWEGFKEIPMEQLSPGDLIFFGLSKDAIRHVGMYLGNGEFIHSTVAENAPYIHISRIAEPEWNGSGRFAYHTARTLQSNNQALTH